jgi:hypothetical protein
MKNITAMSRDPQKDQLNELEKIKSLRFHEEMELASDQFHSSVKRVPGGLLYIIKVPEYGQDASNYKVSTQFVPFEPKAFDNPFD